MKRPDAIWEQLPFDREVTAVAAVGALLYTSTPAGLHVSTDDGATWKRLRGPATKLAAGPNGLWADLEFTSDGATWTAASSPPMPQRGPTALGALALAPSGEVWAGFSQDWLSFYPGQGNPPILHAASMVSDFLFRGPDWKLVREDLRVTGFAFDSRGRVWIGANMGVFVDGERVFDRAAQCIAVDRADRVVVGTSCPSFVSSDGKSFVSIAPTYRETGSWGSIEGKAQDLRVLARGPDGAVWGGGDGVFRLGGMKWESVSCGISLIPKVGMRQGSIDVTSLAFTSKAFATVRGLGLFRLSL